MRSVIQLDIRHDRNLPNSFWVWFDGFAEGFGAAVGGAVKVRRINRVGQASGGNDGPVVWKRHPVHTDYEVSSYGEVRSVDRMSRALIPRPIRGRVMAQHALPSGHMMVGLYGSGGAKRAYVHRLVLETFVGPAPDDKPFALHGNGIPGDNRLSNLRWGDVQENSADKWKHGTQSGARLTEEQVLAIRADGRKHPVIAREYGIGVSNVQKIKYGKTWQHLHSQGVEAGVSAKLLTEVPAEPKPWEKV